MWIRSWVFCTAQAPTGGRVARRWGQSLAASLCFGPTAPGLRPTACPPSAVHYRPAHPLRGAARVEPWRQPHTEQGFPWILVSCWAGMRQRWKSTACSLRARELLAGCKACSGLVFAPWPEPSSREGHSASWIQHRHQPPPCIFAPLAINCWTPEPWNVRAIGVF